MKTYFQLAVISLEDCLLLYCTTSGGQVASQNGGQWGWGVKTTVLQAVGTAQDFLCKLDIARVGVGEEQYSQKQHETRILVN